MEIALAKSLPNSHRVPQSDDPQANGFQELFFLLVRSELSLIIMLTLGVASCGALKISQHNVESCKLACDALSETKPRVTPNLNQVYTNSKFLQALILHLSAASCFQIYHRGFLTF